MATATQNSAPLSRLSRLGLGLGLKSSSASPSRARGNHKHGTEDEWYIPYSGPYEPPREPFRRRKERDSWGDPIDAENDADEDTAMASIELHKRYVVGSSSQAGEGQWDGGGANDKAAAGRDHDSSRTEHRDRTQSGVSGRTVSSGLVDPSRTSMASQRRSTVSSAQRPPVPSYINLDATGGVGESPVPSTHKRNSSKESNRTSIAGLFTFGGQPRIKPVPEQGAKKLFSRKLSRSGRPSTGISSGIGPTTAMHRRSSSTGSNSVLGRSNTLPRGNNNGADATDSDDYYNSYYFSTRASQNAAPVKAAAQSAHPYESASSSTPSAGKTTPSPTSSTRHPYAYVFPTSQSDGGARTAPLPSSNSRTNPPSSSPVKVDPPRLTFTEPPPPLQKPASANVAQSQFSLSFPFQKGLKQLKNSASTPDLRLRANPSTNPPLIRLNALSSKASPTYKPKDRWLSAETWCDALLFPRPRLKIKHDFGEGSSGRIVSPPGSPVRRGLEEQPIGNGVAERGIASRVLVHSRSLVDLNKSAPSSAAADEQSASLRAAPGPSSSQTRLHPPQDGVPLPTRTDRPPRPKSWALDDLALPTPVPSLARVLEDGEKLESQRKQWKEQATQSFQNKRTRSVSRARSKSMTQKGRRLDEPRPSNMDFLAARACLGNQLLTPVIAPAKVPDIQTASFAGSSSSKSHSHSNSLVKTLSKSSKSHSRGHSRADSMGRSALKMAKIAACGLTGADPGLGSPFYATDNGLESMLRGGGTKVIRLADPALVVASDNTPSTSNSPTPSGSAASDARIGIALTTPPLVDNPVDLDAVRLPAHPYAQAGLYSYSTFVPAAQPEREVAAETLDHEAPLAQDDNKPKPGHILALDPSSRQHEPPPSVPYHPYAHRSPSSDSYDPDSKLVRRPRDDSDIPAPAKMWAQLSPGIVREILPGDIQYSPFMSENGDVSSRNSRVIYDTVGVGETLAYAARAKTSHDSGLGTSEEHTVVDPGQPQVPSLSGKRSYRQPVQYDTNRPPHLSQQEKKHAAPHSAHTFASSPLLYQQTPPLDIPRKHFDEVHLPRTTSTSPESLSPPQSPRSFGNPDDLENFYDLFYKPSRASAHQSIPSEMGAVSMNGTLPGSRRTGGSGLTSLARQLSEEFEQMAHEREGSQYSRTSTIELQGPIGRRPTDSTLEFVFEETSPPESSATGQSPPSGHSRISPFQPSSVHIPEDVESSRASSPLEPDEDETELFRVGMVESVSTPPAVASDHRVSYMGELSPPEGQQAHPEVQEVAALSPQPRINSGLQPPSADPTRSSYMTTSTGSRISNLSDFPAPPQRHPVGHMSLLTSYFDEAHSLSEAHASQDTTPPLIPPSHDDADEMRNRRLTFGGEDSEIEDLVAALSSHSHSTASHS